MASSGKIVELAFIQRQMAFRSGSGLLKIETLNRFHYIKSPTVC